MGRLEIRILGGLPVTRPGIAIVGFGSDLVRALLAFLTPQTNLPHRRAALAAVLWRDQALGEEFLPAQLRTSVKAHA